MKVRVTVFQKFIEAPIVNGQEMSFANTPPRFLYRDVGQFYERVSVDNSCNAVYLQVDSSEVYPL